LLPTATDNFVQALKAEIRKREHAENQVRTDAVSAPGVRDI
jgi:hypothetical protein